MAVNGSGYLAVQDVTGGTDGRELGGGFGGRGGDILEFERDYADAASESPYFIQIVVGSDHFYVGYLARGRVRIG